MTAGNVFQRLRHEVSELGLQLPHRLRGFRHLSDDLPAIDHHPGNQPHPPALNTAECTRQAELQVAETLLDAFRAGAVRR